jgi:hypothetical protein
VNAWPTQYIAHWSNLPGWVSLLGPVFSTLVIIATAWIAAAWEWAKTPKQAIRIGAATGFLAAAAAYVLIGTTLAGLLGLEPMLKHGLPRLVRLCSPR